MRKINMLYGEKEIRRIESVIKSISESNKTAVISCEGIINKIKDENKSFVIMTANKTESNYEENNRNSAELLHEFISVGVLAKMLKWCPENSASENSFEHSFFFIINGEDKSHFDNKKKAVEIMGKYYPNGLIYGMGRNVYLINRFGESEFYGKRSDFKFNELEDAYNQIRRDNFKLLGVYDPRSFGAAYYMGSIGVYG